MSNTNITDVLALAISHIRASGPVSLADVADYLFDQSSAVTTVEQAQIEATLAVRHGLGCGSIHTDESGTSFFA